MYMIVHLPSLSMIVTSAEVGSLGESTPSIGILSITVNAVSPSTKELSGNVMSTVVIDESVANTASSVVSIKLSGEFAVPD